MSKENTILIVDDSRENIVILSGILKEIANIVFSTFGEDALQKAQDILPSIILLDIAMPGMDGYEVLKRLKLNLKTRDIPVIFVTGIPDTENEERALNLGAVDYITKPYAPSVVKARVQIQLDLHKLNYELRMAYEKLKEANRLKEDIEYIAKHDLKAPLNNIIGFPDLLLMEGNLTEKQKRILNWIKQTGNQMLNMINVSLNLHKIEDGSYNFSPQPVNISLVINNTINDLHHLIQNKSVTITIYYQEKPITKQDQIHIYGEHKLCYSLFINLIKNAVEASPEQVEIQIRMNEEPDFICITISNQGEVPDLIREKFFDKYVTHGKVSGIGLGTYSAKLMTEIQKGKIVLDTSIIGKTIIHVKLPMLAEVTL